MRLHSFHVDVDRSDLDQVRKALSCRSVSGGSEVVREYEACLARYFGVRYALAFSSGTSALHGALAALEVGPGDEVILSSAGTIEAVLAILQQNAVPVFVDVQENRFDWDLADLEGKIGPRTRAAVCVPMWGYPLNIDPVVRLCRDRGVPVVEDIALSVGASAGGRKLGTWGAIGCASTHERKLICTGEGGFTLTNDEALADRMREVQRYGMVYRKGPAWEQIRRRAGYLLGWNYKLNAFTAAVGISQIQKLDDKIRKRTAHAREIADRLADCPAAHVYAAKSGDLANSYALVVDLRDLRGKTARDFALRLRDEGVISDTLEYDYRPLYESPLLRHRSGYGTTACPFTCARYGQNYRPVRCRQAEQFMNSLITLPTHEALTAQQREQICDSFHKVYRSL